MATNDVVRSMFITEFETQINQVVEGKLDLASARLAIKQALNAKGFWPNPASNDPDTWLNTILRTNIALRQQARYG